MERNRERSVCPDCCLIISAETCFYNCGHVFCSVCSSAHGSECPICFSRRRLPAPGDAGSHKCFLLVRSGPRMFQPFYLFHRRSVADISCTSYSSYSQPALATLKHFWLSGQTLSRAERLLAILDVVQQRDLEGKREEWLSRHVFSAWEVSCQVTFLSSTS